MQRTFLALAFLVLTADFASAAGPFRLFRRAAAPANQTYSAQPRFPVVAGVFSSAQGVAEHMARIGRIGHFGGNSGYEGCGSGPTPYAAEMNCCFRNRMQPREVGLAQGANGMWYACCRY